MIGRENEQARLSEFLASGEGQALVLRGEAGIGKSLLLDHLAGAATEAGHEVIRATGTEAESRLPFAGLHQLLYPLLPDIEGLDPVHRTVFDAVFGHGEGNPPSVMSLGIAVLDLLALAASGRPLLLCLDDGQWLDASSIEVYGFVARRLAGSSVKLTVGLRSGVPSGFATAALPELPVGALTDTAAGQLLDLRHPGLGPHLRHLVLQQASGNPLALLELPPHLNGAPSGAPADSALGLHGVPLPRRLHLIYGTRVRGLDGQVREELLRGALDGVAAGAAPAPGSRRYGMRDVEAAAAAGLLEVEPSSGDFVFSHPLVRSTVVQLATPNQRRAAHAALARTHRDDAERRATHLAAATVDPDEQVAAALETAADSAVRRGSAAAAVAWLTRAAELSETQEDRARRLGDAAFVTGHAGDLDQARRLAVQGQLSHVLESPASVVTSAYVSFIEDGDVRASHHRVTAAIENLRDERPGRASAVLVQLVNLLLAMDQYAGDQAQWEQTRALLDSLGDLVPTRSRVYADAWSDVTLHGKGLHERLEREFADRTAMEPWDITRLSVAAYHVDALSQYRPHLQRTVDRESRTGFVRNGMTMLHLIMLDQTAVGEWPEAERTAQRSLELAEAHDYTLFAHHSRIYLALLAALRGESERARELQAAVESWARPRGVGFLTHIADAVGTLSALGEGDHEAAYLHAIGLTPPGVFTPYIHQSSRSLLDLVEAAMHTGRSEQARRHAVAAHEAGLPAISPRLALITYGALAMTAPDDAEAADMYHRAESHPGSARFPFELSRIRLAHGIRLRHGRSPMDARPSLVRAAETFERLGAAPWAERARAELRASGLVTRPAAPRPAELTWHERRIAELAAGGLTNKEIGERLRLSPRTVSSHLYRVFPKLGITSRAALRDALLRTENNQNA
ncbi:AAA family ATPase [Streptomyces sp. NPDC017638]|uniref:AAA family ATPase n=1 Tax=Streptomyces sp. NPDC017638 TaxID=3365004 RepID=UPI0037B2F946